METKYTFENNNHTLVETTTAPGYTHTSKFSYVSMNELEELTKGPNNQDNDRNLKQIFDIIKNSTIESNIAGIYLDTTFGADWGAIYFVLKSEFIDNSLIHFLSALRQAHADELTFEQPNLIRAWWD